MNPPLIILIFVGLNEIIIYLVIDLTNQCNFFFSRWKPALKRRFSVATPSKTSVSPTSGVLATSAGIVSTAGVGGTAIGVTDPGSKVVGALCPVAILSALIKPFNRGLQKAVCTPGPFAQALQPEVPQVCHAFCVHSFLSRGGAVGSNDENGTSL